MASPASLLKQPIVFKYLALPPQFAGRGGVVKNYMKIHSIKFEDQSDLAFPLEPKVRQDLIDSGMSAAGTVPVLTMEGKHFTGHIAILRYLEKKMKITGDADEEYALDQAADEYVTWRDTWAATLGKQQAAVDAYNAKRGGFFDLLEVFYNKRSAKNTAYLLGSALPRYTDVAVATIISDDAAVFGAWDFSKHPNLEAVYNGVQDLLKGA